MKLLLIVAFILSAQMVNAEDHDHHTGHGHAKASKIKDLGTKKFTPTEDLKVRMEKILSSMKELKDKNNDKREVQKYGEIVSSTVSDIFKTCKLDKAADAAIHPVLAQLLRGAKELKKGGYDKGHSEIHDALLNYEKLFSHKNWKH